MYLLKYRIQEAFPGKMVKSASYPIGTEITQNVGNNVLKPLQKNSGTPPPPTSEGGLISDTFSNSSSKIRISF